MQVELEVSGRGVRAEVRPGSTDNVLIWAGFRLGNMY
jgi:hypothetical protein